MSKKFSAKELSDAVVEARMTARQKQIERSAGIMQAYADKISSLEGALVIARLERDNTLDKLTNIQKQVQAIYNSVYSMDRDQMADLLLKALTASD